VIVKAFFIAEAQRTQSSAEKEIVVYSANLCVLCASAAK